tara:strand:- start:3476 stop:4585 length:1110 start_codon:yes stop_codon:yes gene_type:complete
MKDYIGVKFRPKLTSKGIRNSISKEIIAAGKRLGEEGLVFANSGNISGRSKNGFIITALGSELDRMGNDDFALVTGCDMKSRFVLAEGKKNPSTEAIIHHLIYMSRADAKAVVYASAGVFLNESKIANTGLLSTDVFIENGTLELAYNIVKTLGASPFIIVKDHGAIALGSSVQEATDLMINKFRELKGLPVRVSDVPKQVSVVEPEEEPEHTPEQILEAEPEAEMPKDFFEGEEEGAKGRSGKGAPEHRGAVEPKEEPTTDNRQPTAELVNPWGGEVFETEGAEPAKGYLDDLPDHDATPTKKFSFKLPKLKIKLPGLKSNVICPNCGMKKKFASRSCANCGYYFKFDKVSQDTSNFIKVEKKNKVKG